MTSSTKAGIARIYVSQLGDTFETIAQKFYQDATLAKVIADANGATLSAIIPIGTRLQIPAPAAPGQNTLPTGNVTSTMENGVETIEVAAAPLVPSRSDWLKDWRVWAAVVAVGGLAWYLSRGRRRA